MVWCFGFRFYGFKLLVEVGRENVNPPLLRRLHPLDEELQNEIKGYCALSYSDENICLKTDKSSTFFSLGPDRSRGPWYWRRWSFYLFRVMRFENISFFFVRISSIQRLFP
jgi:hypothetical protein